MGDLASGFVPSARLWRGIEFWAAIISAGNYFFIVYYYLFLVLYSVINTLVRGRLETTVEALIPYTFFLCSRLARCCWFLILANFLSYGLAVCYKSKYKVTMGLVSEI